MKYLITTIAAVVLVGCGETQQSAPAETKPVELVAEAETVELITEAVKQIPLKANAPDITIHDAAGDGNIESVKQFLASGTDVNAKFGDGTTPLHWAVTFGHKEIAELLIARGANVNAKTRSGITPLHKAAAFADNPKIAELLIAKGAKVNSMTQYGTTPLHSAADNGNKRLAELLIAKGAEINQEGDNGETPLDRAIDNYPETAELLRKHGAKRGEKKGEFHYAIALGSISEVEVLLADGANVNEIATLYGSASTPLDAAIKMRQEEIADLLRKHGGKTGEELKAEGK